MLCKFLDERTHSNLGHWLDHRSHSENMNDPVSESCIEKLSRDTEIDLHESPVIQFGIVGAVFQKNGHKAITGWVKNENMLIETVMKIGAKTYSVAGVVGAVDVWIGIVESHEVEHELCVLVFGNEAGVEA